jgi:acetyl-CoA carboxylase biotin carboxyl carrier protein
VAQARERSADPKQAAEGSGGVSKPDAASPAWADLDFLRGLIEVVDGSGIDSLEITRSGTRIKISKTPPAGAGPSYYPPFQYPSQPAGSMGGPGAQAGPGGNAAGAATPEPAAAPAESAAAGSAGGAAAAAASGLVDITSPMVGTFYQAPAPEAPPYVEVGARVSKGQTLCIIEAMKLMNELESEVEGVVRQVLVENAEPVEYGQVLFRIDPAG